MSIFRAKHKTSLKAIEADLAELMKRRDKLRGRLAEAVFDVDRAAAERRRLLIEVDEPEPSAMAKAEAACRAADDVRAGIEDALRHAAEKVADLEQSIAELTDRADRAAAAEQIADRALMIDVAVGDLQDVAKSLAERHAALIEVIRKSGRIAGPHGFDLAPETVAVAILDAAIRSFEPRLVPRTAAFTGSEASSDPMLVGQAMASGPLRDLASRIRAGQAAPLVPEPPFAAPPLITFVDVEMVLDKPIRFRGPSGRFIEVIAGGVMLPEPVARAVVRMGIGEPRDTDDGRRRLALMKTKLDLSYGFRDGFTDVGVDLYELARAPSPLAVTSPSSRNPQ